MKGTFFTTKSINGFVRSFLWRGPGGDSDVDGRAGSVDDMFFGDEDWSICYLAIDTRSWLPGKHVAVPVEWAKNISWEERKVAFEHLKQEKSKAPEYSVRGYLTPKYLRALESYYQGSETRIS